MFKIRIAPFFQKPVFVCELIKSDNNFNYPKIEIKDEFMFNILKLAKAGYYNGNVEKILKAPSDIILKLFQFEKFNYNYELNFHELNRPQEDY